MNMLGDRFALESPLDLSKDKLVSCVCVCERERERERDCIIITAFIIGNR
jgi:hypothetical protein